MEWFGHAAAQGHAHSSYNLAIGHLKGFKTKLDPGEAHEHIKYAADQGFHLAKDVLLHVCKHGGCTDWWEPRFTKTWLINIYLKYNKRLILTYSYFYEIFY